MKNEYILSTVRGQLAIDLNCLPDDFDRNGFVFCQARNNPGRRPFPRDARHFDMLTMGGAIIVSATPDILPFLRDQLDGKSRDDAYAMPFVYGHSLYYLPDDICPMALPDCFSIEIAEQPMIQKLYALDHFHNALSYDISHPRPDVLVMSAKLDEMIIGMAGASADCEMLWQIGVDVLPEYRNRGIAAVLTNWLALEILQRGRIPYYGTSSVNIASQRVAHRAGFRPAWVCAYRGVFDGIAAAPTS